MDIFKKNDIRTNVENLNERNLEKLGKALAYYYINDLKFYRFIVGRDMRESSPKIAKKLISVLGKYGVEAIDIGIVTTDMTYFASGKYKLPSIMITASHNPKEYNGIKFTSHENKPISMGSGLEKIKEYFENIDSILLKELEVGYDELDLLLDYRDNLVKIVNDINTKKLNVVVDAGNAMGSLIPGLFLKEEYKITELYCELDGNFPNHEPNPLKKENLQDLVEKVKNIKADLGVAFDGDADRAFFVNDMGEIVESNTIIMLITNHLQSLEDDISVTINTNVSVSVEDKLISDGVKVVRAEVGHGSMKKKLRDENSIFGGEHSGHFYYRDFYYSDSGALTMLYILKILKNSNLKFSELTKNLPKLHSIEEKSYKLKNINSAVNKICEKLNKTYKIDYSDGVILSNESGRVLLRASNTEPVLRLNIENRNFNEVTKILKVVEDIIKEVD